MIVKLLVYFFLCLVIVAKLGLSWEEPRDIPDHPVSDEPISSIIKKLPNSYGEYDRTVNVDAANADIDPSLLVPNNKQILVNERISAEISKIKSMHELAAEDKFVDLASKNVDSFAYDKHDPKYQNLDRVGKELREWLRVKVLNTFRDHENPNTEDTKSNAMSSDLLKMMKTHKKVLTFYGDTDNMDAMNVGLDMASSKIKLLQRSHLVKVLYNTRLMTKLGILKKIVTGEY